MQFAQPLGELDMERLRADYDLALDRYIPNLAFLERVEPDALGRLAGDFLVRATTALDPALKLSPSINGNGTPPSDGALTPSSAPRCSTMTMRMR